MSRIFLSHSSLDDFAALALRDWLASEGWEDVFLDLDPDRGIVAGQRWERSLYEAASRCEAVVFLVSDNWLGSGWCLKEYMAARRLNKKLFAVLIDPTKTIKDLPADLTDTWQVTDLASGQDMRLFRVTRPDSHEERHVGFSRNGLIRLKRGLQKAGLDARFFAWPPETDPRRSPYRGLKPLEADDAGIFFGRDAPIVEATDRLRGLAAGAAPRIMVILGASGAGKSSFLRAGLLPRLVRDDTHFVALPPIRPERAAITGENGLLKALEYVCPNRTRAELRSAVQAGEIGVRPILEELAQMTYRQTLAEEGTAKPPAIVVAIDQAEELFRAENANEGQALLTLVRDLTTSDAPVSVIAIFVIRSDSYDALERAKPLEGLRQDALPLLPMPRGAYKEVIEGPAQRVSEAGRKLEIEPQLTERLLQDIEDGNASDALPLLSFTLEQLYLDYHPAGILKLADYAALGGLKGAIDAAVKRALVRANSDSSIPPRTDAREALLRRGLIPWLAGIDPDTKAPRRNIARRADIPPESLPLINLLVDERLLSTDILMTAHSGEGQSRIVTIEPAHEALLRQWELLKGWLEADFGLLAVMEGLKRAARDWDANGRSDPWLTHQGQRLAEARAIDARPDIAAKLNAIDVAYVSGCQAKENTARLEAEKRQREREDEQARRLADAQALAAANRRTVVRTRIGLLVAVLALLGVSTLVGFVLSAKKEETAQRRISERNLELATGIANGLVFDLMQKFQNAAGVPESMIKAILDQALKLQQSLIDSGQANPELRRNQTVALNQAVATLLSLGDLRDALEDATRSLNIMTKLVKLQPSNKVWRDDLANSFERLGDALRQMGKPSEALAAYSEDNRITSLLAASDTNPVAEHNLTVSFGKIGEVKLQNGDQSGALAAFHKELDISRSLTATGFDALAKRDLLISYINLAGAQRRGGAQETALHTYEQELSIARQLAAKDDNAQTQRDLAIGFEKVGDLRLAMHDIAGASSAFEQAHNLYQILARDRSNAQAQRDLAINFYALGKAKLRNNVSDAFSDYEKGLSLLQDTASDKSNLQALRDLAIGFQKLGDAKLWSADSTSAISYYQRETVIFKDLAKDPDNTQAQRGLAESLAKIGSAQRVADNPAGALDAFNESLARRRLLAKDRSNLQVQGGLVFDLANIGDLERAMGDAAGSRRADEDRLSIMRAMPSDEARGWERYTAAVTEAATNHGMPTIDIDEFEQGFGYATAYERDQHL